MAKMVNERLKWYIEKYQIISTKPKYQNQLIQLKAFIRDGLVQKYHVITVFFGLEKAYNTTWKYGIMTDIYNIGLKSRLTLFTQNFLKLYFQSLEWINNV